MLYRIVDVTVLWDQGNRVFSGCIVMQLFDKIFVIHIVTGQIDAIQILELSNILDDMSLVIFRGDETDIGRQGRILFSVSCISFSEFGSYSK